MRDATMVRFVAADVAVVVAAAAFERASQDWSERAAADAVAAVDRFDSTTTLCLCVCVCVCE